MRALNVEYGDARTAYTNEVLRTVVGSGVHGIAIEGTDDHDEMGIFIEPPEWIFGPTMGLDDEMGQPKRRREDFTYRTQPEGERSGPGDVDLVIYTLRKYLRLALKGNPTALLPLFAPTEAVLVRSMVGDDLRAMRYQFLSQEAVHRFLGYMHAQRERMMGEGKRNRVPKRPELEERYGWDVKFGGHALRLAYQGMEIALDGHLTLPLRENERQHVLAVKRGEVSRDQVADEIATIETLLKRMLELGTIDLPKTADVQSIAKWSAMAHRGWWMWS